MAVSLKSYLVIARVGKAPMPTKGLRVSDKTEVASSKMRKAPDARDSKAHCFSLASSRFIKTLIGSRHSDLRRLRVNRKGVMLLESRFDVTNVTVRRTRRADRWGARKK